MQSLIDSTANKYEDDNILATRSTKVTQLPEIVMLLQKIIQALGSLGHNVIF